MFKFFQKKQDKHKEDLLTLVIEMIGKLSEKKRTTQQISAATQLDSLGFDSLMYIEFVVKLESITGITLEKIAARVDFLSIETIGQLAQALEDVRNEA